MKLIIARHGLTDWNLSGRFQGQTDTSLNQTGSDQALALGKWLANEKLDYIYCSDLQRAHKTALAVAQHQSCPVQKDNRLRELNFGEWEGLTFQQIQKRHPNALKDWLEIPIEAAPPGGETLSQMADRIESILGTIRRKHKNGTVLLVAHGGPIQVLLCLALNIPPICYWQFSISQASISELGIYPQGAILNRMNETCHLRNQSLALR